MRHVKLPGTRAGFTPGLTKPPLGREAMDACIAIAVRDIEVAVGPDGKIGRVVERSGRALNGPVIDTGRASVRGDAAGSKREAQRAVASKGADGVTEVVGAIDGIIGTDENAVRPGEDAVAPGGERVAGAIADHDRMRRAASEKNDLVLRVTRDAHNLSAWSVRRRRPALIHAKAKLAFADDHGLAWARNRCDVHFSP